MTVKQHTPARAQSSTSARTTNRPAKPARPKHAAASDKKGNVKGKAAGSKLRLSDPTTVGRVFKLQRDEPFDSGDFLCVGDTVSDLLSYADADVTSREVFALAFPLAARRVERNSGKASVAAQKAYRELVRVLARLDAGETLEEIEKAERARYQGQRAAQRAADLAAPEPKDKLSDKWRIWKLRQVEHAFGDARLTDGGREPYEAAHAYYAELLRSLFYCEDFRRTDFILRLLPELISIRQEIDEMYRREGRMRAGMKGAETRKRNAAKKGGE